MDVDDMAKYQSISKEIQKIDSEIRQSEIINITKEMITELTEEVRKVNQLFVGISPSISRCINHIRLHYPDNITLDDLCSISSMSKANLTRRFQKETGTTISTYIRNARCHHAVSAEGRWASVAMPILNRILWLAQYS